MTLDKLIKQLGTEKCSQLSSTLVEYKTDKSYEEGVIPALLVIAQSAIDIKVVLDFANKYNIPLTVRGAGSGKSGGAIPEKGGILLSLEKFDQILELDLKNSCMTVEPGVITDTIKDAAKQVGLFYPPGASKTKDMFLELFQFLKFMFQWPQSETVLFGSCEKRLLD